MKGLSITGLVLGLAGPLVLIAPLLGALFGGEDYWAVGWVLLLLTIPLGLMLQIAGSVLVIVAASLALKRRFRPRSVPIVGITLTGSGLLLEIVALAGIIGPAWGWEVPVLGLGMVVAVTGVIMSAVTGLRPELRLRR